MSMSPNSITLHPALPADALSLAQLHNAAFANNSLMETMYGPLSQEDPDPPFANHLDKIIREDPHARIVKAVDETSGRIVGWSWWSIYADAEAHARAAAEARDRSARPPATALCPGVYLDFQDLKAGVRERWIGGRAVAILQVLVVHPMYQGRGVGTKLLMVGVDEARRLSLPAWLEASEEGYAVYRRCGFRDAERIELDFAKHGLTGIRHVYCMLMDDVVEQ